MSPPTYDEALHSALHCVALGHPEFAEAHDLERLQRFGCVTQDTEGRFILTDVGRQTIREWNK